MIRYQKYRELSINDKLIELMKPSNFNKLVLVQQQELEIINNLNRVKDSKHTHYIEQLHKHYIVEGKPKTYLC